MQFQVIYAIMAASLAAAVPNPITAAPQHQITARAEVTETRPTISCTTKSACSTPIQSCARCPVTPQCTATETSCTKIYPTPTPGPPAGDLGQEFLLQAQIGPNFTTGYYLAASELSYAKDSYLIYGNRPETTDKTATKFQLDPKFNRLVFTGNRGTIIKSLTARPGSILNLAASPDKSGNLAVTYTRGGNVLTDKQSNGIDQIAPWSLCLDQGPGGPTILTYTPEHTAYGCESAIVKVAYIQG